VACTGYVVAFEPEDSEGYVAFLRQHGFCVVHVLTDEVLPRCL
jgi:hypothetical protein